MVEPELGKAEPLGEGADADLLEPGRWKAEADGAPGAFTKGLGFPELWLNHLALAGFTVAFLAVAALILRKQEA